MWSQQTTIRWANTHTQFQFQLVWSAQDNRAWHYHQLPTLWHSPLHHQTLYFCESMKTNSDTVVRLTVIQMLWVLGLTHLHILRLQDSKNYCPYMSSRDHQRLTRNLLCSWEAGNQSRDILRNRCCSLQIPVVWQAALVEVVRHRQFLHIQDTNWHVRHTWDLLGSNAVFRLQ